MDKDNGAKPKFVVLLEAEISSKLRYLLSVNDAEGGSEIMRTALLDSLNDLQRSVGKWHLLAPAPGFKDESRLTTRQPS